MKPEKFVRMTSWWLSWEDLSWPRAVLEDKIRYRADRFLANHINTAVIFGTHFRWDLMPLWQILHDELHFIAEELHQRGIALWDHHSAVLTHRWHSMDERRRMSLFTPHHLPFCPSRDIAAEWTFRGKRLNDWRMISTDTHEPVFLPAYTAEEFCINNPDFRDCYTEYVRMLVRDTGIDGLMCDDAFFYPRFSSCACPFCLKKFGHELPPVSNLTFWGNWENPLFREWIAMRYRSVAEFNNCVKNALPEHMFLSNCCSQSVCSASNELALDYTVFAESSTHVEMEICGSIPNPEHGLFTLFGDQLYHLAIADSFQRYIFSLGYAFTENAADFVWSLNKFLGSGTWISCAKHSLRISEEEQKALPDDFELPGHCFGIEQDYPEWFSGQHCPDVLILFSKATRDNYGGYMADYADDYVAACQWLLEHGYDCGTVMEIPDPANVCAQVLVLASTVVLSSSGREKIQAWLAAGRKVVACGPVGWLNEKIEPEPFIENMIFPELKRDPVFPSDTWGIPMEPARCQNPPRWQENPDGFFWHPERMQDGLDLKMPADIPCHKSSGWGWRKFRDPQGNLLEHYFALYYSVDYDQRIESIRFAKGVKKINRISPADRVSQILFPLPFDRTEIFVPLESHPESFSKTEFRTKRNSWYVIFRHSAKGKIK